MRPQQRPRTERTASPHHQQYKDRDQDGCPDILRPAGLDSALGGKSLRCPEEDESRNAGQKKLASEIARHLSLIILAAPLARPERPPFTGPPAGRPIREVALPTSSAVVLSWN